MPSGSENAAIRFDPTESVFKAYLQKSMLPQIRQLFLHISNSNGKFDGFLGKLTRAKTTLKTLGLRSGCEPPPLVYLSHLLMRKIACLLGLIDSLPARVENGPAANPLLVWGPSMVQNVHSGPDGIRYRGA